ncbi:cytochrome P450 [Streptomyces sp. NPDC056632]|uniref:cytochrome P450 n=1 Tax=Streptomyces sp. NPDC056632 TaxID=3345884 RepID=UPI0036BC75E9
MRSDPTAQTDFTTGAARGALPLVGHARQLMWEPIAFLGSLSSYGDLVEIRLGPQRAYVPTHPELVRQVLTNDRVFDKRGTLWDLARDLMGNGLVTCAHQDHRRQRRLAQPAFRPDALGRYASMMEEEISLLTKEWRDGQVVDVFPAMSGLFLRIAARTLFSAHVDGEGIARIQESAETVLAKVFPRMLLPSALRGLPIALNRDYHQALRQLRTMVDRIIADYRRTGEKHCDLLSMLLTGGDGESEPASDSEIHAQVVTMLIAGSETSATTLTWALHLLTEHPEVERRLRDELDAVLDGRPARWADLPELSYTARVIKETLRLRPPTWILTRSTTTETELGGRRLRPGTVVVLSAYAMQLNAAVHDSPGRFDPDRWLPENESSLQRGAFSAFGGGARKCIGDSFSKAETALALATVMGRWRPRQARGADLRTVPLGPVSRPRRLLLELRPPEPAQSRTDSLPGR